MISSSRLRNSGRKASRDHRHHLVARGLGRLVLRQAREILAAQVRGQHDQRVAEVDGAALAVGQAAVVEHLEQHVEHVRMRLLDLVEQDHLVGPPAHRLGQRAALLVADIAGRRADQARDRVLLHVLRHVDADHRLLVVEQELGQRLAELGLADAGRAQEQERADRPVRVLQAGARAAHGVADRGDRLVLADHARCAASPSICSSLSRSPSSIRSTGTPVQRDTTWAMSLSVTSSWTISSALACLGLGELALELRDLAVGDLAGARQVALALRHLELVAQLVELLLQLLALGVLLLLRLPRAVSSADCCSSSASSFSSSARRSFEALSVSFLSASRSILSCMMRRSSSSIASGLESITMRLRAAASSIRSIALSGRKRSVM